MATTRLTAVAARLRRERPTAVAPGDADRDLLDRFVRGQDEDAFRALVRRHERLVRSAVGRVLSDPDDADDAFQATFLVLVRRARAVQWRAGLGPWLYGVAHRVAVRARDAGRARARREAAARPVDPVLPPDLSWPEACALLHAELDRLPDKYRLPLLLCYLDGKARDEAAAALGVTAATLKGRLERGRRRLRERLARRGVAPSVALLAAVGAGPVRAGTGATPAALIAVVRGAAPGRVDALAREAVAGTVLGRVARPLSIAVGLAAAATIALLAATPAAPPVAAGPPQPPPTATVPPPAPAAEWAVPVTYRGQPVAGAKVQLVPYTSVTPGDPKPGTPAYATTDAKGVARFPKTAELGAGAFARLLARDGEGRGGYGALYGDTYRHPPTIELFDNAQVSGRLADADGKPVAGLTLRPFALGPDGFARFGGRPTSLSDTPEWFWAASPLRPAADGSFTATGVPAGHSVAVRFEAPGFGSGRVWVLPGKPAVVGLHKAGALRLRFTPPPGGAPGDVRVVATRTASADLLEATGEGVAQAGADVTLPGLPPGEYQIGFPYDGPGRHFPKAVGAVEVRPGETTEVTTALEPAARVTARLVDSRTGQGVPGAGLSATVSFGLGRAVAPGQVATVPAGKADADGRVELLVPAGTVQVRPAAADGYAVVRFTADPFNSYSTQPVEIRPGKAHDFGTFSLVRTVEVPGVVVDEAGRPVAGADVSVGYSGSNFYTGKPIATGPDGRFAVAGMSPEGGAFGVTARKGDAVAAAPVAADPGKPGAEVRVVVSERFAARVRARAVDRGGRPVAGAAIEFARSVSYLSRGGAVSGGGTAERAGATGPDGRFDSGAVQPGDRYGVTFSGPGFRTATTAEWVAEPGAVKDFGDVVLTRSDAAVTGTVTDAAGRPVAGATVFSNADGPRPAAATTDAAGRFTLGGLYEGPGFVSAQADGFRLASAPAEAGGPAVRVVVRRRADPPAPAPVESEEDRAAATKMTRSLLEAMWENRAAVGDDGRAVVRAMARFDPAVARRWRDEELARTGGRVDLAAEISAARRESSLVGTARQDPDEAVAILRDETGPAGFRAVCRLAERLLPDAPEAALRVAEEAVARARGADEPDRPTSLARAGELVFRAGRKDAGRKIIEEAAGLAAPLGHTEPDAFRRGTVAARVALYDPARARAMIDPIRDAGTFNRWLAQALVRAAEADPAAAGKWFADFRPDNSFARATAGQQAAYRLARSDPDAAVRIARGIDDGATRAVTLAGVAARLADRARALALIDEAADRIVADASGTTRPVYYGGAAGAAALVLFRAKQLGHPDLAGLRDKALAAREPPPVGPFRGSEQTAVAFAAGLALTDPATARLVLARAVPPAERAAVNGIRDREVLVALALADPGSFGPAADAAIAQGKRDRKGYLYTGLDAVALTLTDPDRLAENVARYARLFGEFEEE